MKAKVKTQASVVVRTRTDCRMCGSENLVKIWDFGETPLANNYLLPEQVAAFAKASASQREPFAPLKIYICEDCHLVQMRDVVDPEVLFGNYLYVSSTSPAFVAHFEDYAKTVTDRLALAEKDLVVDIGSNDGVLLKPFKAAGMKVLGVEPAKNIAAQANKDGIETVAEFFMPKLARQLVKKYGSAKLITANNVFAHTDDVDSFVKAVKELLAPDGVYVFEAQYLGDLLAKNLFDIVYHEHVCYYHMHPLVQFFQKHGMDVFDVERPAVHGGSLRVYVQFVDGPHKREQRLDDLLAEEEQAGLNTLSPYQEFAARIEKNKKKLRQIIDDIKRQGKRIAGYGAPAKATTVCYAFGIDGNDLDYIVDDSPLKQGRLMPGTHIPIVSSDVLRGDKPPFQPSPRLRPAGAQATRGTPDYLIVLAWNFAEPIIKNNAYFSENGGKWIIPVPEPQIM